jgi:uncharacterized cysteine cluster protein YcgN (CxxCxxCC family)
VTSAFWSRTASAARRAFAAASRRRADRSARWESLCLRCGRCCCEKEWRAGAYVTNERKPCAHLDTRTRQCTIYTSRFQECDQCRKMTVMHALFVRWLPDTCGYVQHFRFGRSPAKGIVARE